MGAEAVSAAGGGPILIKYQEVHGRKRLQQTRFSHGLSRGGPQADLSLHIAVQRLRSYAVR
jgi:hypothetical protein